MEPGPEGQEDLCGHHHQSEEDLDAAMEPGPEGQEDINTHRDALKERLCRNGAWPGRPGRHLDHVDDIVGQIKGRNGSWPGRQGRHSHPLRPGQLSIGAAMEPGPEGQEDRSRRNQAMRREFAGFCEWFGMRPRN